MVIRSMLFAAVAIAMGATAAHPSGGFPTSMPAAPYMGAPAPEIMSVIVLRHSAQLKALREEGLALRRADGGTLNDVHRAALQARLDKLQASYRRQIELYDAWALDSLGMRKD